MARLKEKMLCSSGRRDIKEQRNQGVPLKDATKRLWFTAVDNGDGFIPCRALLLSGFSRVVFAAVLRSGCN